MRTPFKLLDVQTAPAASRSLLLDMQSTRGMTMNLERAMAAAPGLLAAYSHAMSQFELSSFGPLERQVILQTISAENDCEYCLAWHTAMLLRAGMSAADAAAIREQRELGQPRLESLRLFCTQLARRRGHVSDDEFQEFLAQGWTAQHALEIVLGIGVKTLSNYASSLTRVTVDRVVEKYVVNAAAQSSD